MVQRAALPRWCALAAAVAAAVVQPLVGQRLAKSAVLVEVIADKGVDDGTCLDAVSFVQVAAAYGRSNTRCRVCVVGRHRKWSFEGQPIGRLEPPSRTPRVASDMRNFTQILATTNQTRQASELRGREARILDGQRPLSIPQQAFFLHIPKTAGTFVEDSALVKGFRWGRNAWPGARQEMPDGSLCSYHHVPPSMLRGPGDQDMYNHDGVFCIVRHPYERLLSEYSYRLTVHGIPSYFLNQTECSAEGLNYFVQQALLAYTAGKRFAFDCHLLPQHAFIYDGDRQWCKHVLRMDDLPHAFNDLMGKKGLSVRLEDKKHFTFANRCPNLSVKDLTTPTVLLLDAVYGDDMRAFGFESLAFTQKGVTLPEECNIVTDASGVEMLCPPNHLPDPHKKGVCTGKSDARLYTLPSGTMWPNRNWGVPAAGPPRTGGMTVVFQGGECQTNGVPKVESYCKFASAEKDEATVSNKDALAMSQTLAQGLDKAQSLERKIRELDAELESEAKANVDLLINMSEGVA